MTSQVKRVIVFQCEDPTLQFPEVGDKIQSTLAYSLAQKGYNLVPDNRYDPDWPIHLQKGKRQFVVILSHMATSPARWCISLEDLEYKFLDDPELQQEINPVIQDLINTLPNARNVVWYDNFDFLRSN